MSGRRLCRKSIRKLALVIFAISLSACSGDQDQDLGVEDTAVVSNVSTNGVSEVVFTLSSDQQVPPLSIEGAVAEANFSFDENSSILSGSVSASGLTGDATAAHIHRGFAGSNGDIVFTLEPSSAVANVFSIPDNTVLTGEQINEYLRGEYYVSVQTEANIDGEVRGQLLPEFVRSFRAELSGEEVVPPINTSASGLGVITYQTSTDLIWGTIRVAGIEAAAANLHLASSGEIGPVVIPFTADPNDRTVWHAVAVPAGDILIDILSGLIYFSVTADSDPREIRGKIPGARPLGPLVLP